MRMLTKSTSPLPIRSALDTSHVPPVEAESTPPVPRTCSPITPIRFFQSGREERFGSFTMVPALRPVPRLEGHVKTQPRLGWCMKSKPSALSTCCTASQARINLAVTPRISLPSGVGAERCPCIDTMRKWSSSPNHTKSVFELLWKTH